MMVTTTMNDEREAGHYVVTAHKPSSVLHAIQCHFTGQATKDVLIAKAGILEVRRLINSHDDDDVEQDSISNMYNDDYDGGDDPRKHGLTPNNTTEDQEMMLQQQQLESLPLVLEIPIRGRICILLSFRPPGSDRDFLFFTTERHKYAVLSYQSDEDSIQNNNKYNNAFGPSSNTPPILTTYSIDNVVTHDIGIVNDQNVGREAECGPQAVVGSNNKCIIFHMYDGYIKTFPIKSYKPPPKGKSMTKSLSGSSSTNEYPLSTERSKPGSFLPATHNTRTGATVLGVPFHCRLHEHTVLTMTCLLEHLDDTTRGGSSSWVKLCILHQDSKGFQHLITHTIDVKKRKMIFTSLPSAMRRPNNNSSSALGGGSTAAMTSQGGPAAAAVSSSAVASSMKPSSFGDATGAAMTMSNAYGSSSTTSPTTSTTTDSSASGPKRSRIDGGSCLLIAVPPMRVPSANVATAAAVASSSTAAVVGSSGSRMNETSGGDAVAGASTVGTGGLLVIGQMQILYVSAMNTGTKVLPIEPTLTICHTVLPRRRGSDDTTYQCLLADERGLLFLLTLKRHPKTGACTTLLLDTMGLTSIATSLLSITPSVLYVGSRFGDSQLLRINRHRDEETNSFLEILEEYTNLGPIVDMDLVDYDRKGQSQVVTCSGTGRDGSLRIVRNGIGIHEQAHVEFPGIKGMWNLRGGDGDSGNDGSSYYDRYLVQSFLEETRVLEITEDEMEETIAIEGFRSDQPTLFAGNVYYTSSSSSQSSSSSLKLLMIQITESHVRLVDGTTLQAIDTWAPPTTDDEDEEDDPMMEDVASSDRKLITVANGNTSGQIVVALRGGILKYLCVEENEAQQQYKLKVCATKCMDHEVSCIDLHPWTTETGATTTNGDDDDTMTEGTTPSASTSEVGNHPQSDVCAVGLWNDVSVRLLSLNTTTTSSTKLLDEILKLDLGGDTQARSLLLTKLEDNQPPLLLVGLGDGQLVTYFLKINNASVKVISKKKVSLGTQSISLTVFQKHNPFVDHRTTNPHKGNPTNSSSTCVFATGDRPTIVYMSGGKVLYSNVNLTGETTMDHEEDQLLDHGGGAGGGTSSSSSSSSTAAINYVTPFHCELFPDCLCLASEETLRIGFIDDIQKLHVQTFPLRETPQRIVHHMEGRLFAVACLGDTSYDEDGTSTTKAKANLTTSPVGGLTGNQQIVLQGNSLLFLDDTTLEDIDRIHLEPFELVMAVVSVPLGGVSGARIGGGGDVDNDTQTKRIPPLPIRSYIVVGTGFAYPDEDEPTKGRILVFESVRSRGSVAAAATAKPKTTGEDDEEADMAMVSVPPSADGLGGGGRRIRQVTECIVNGGVYSMASFMEHKLLVTINQRVHVYNLIDDSVINRPNAAAVPQVLELKKESAEHHGHILSLCIKAHQNHVLVGDIMRSIGVLEYVEEGGKSESQTLNSDAQDKNTFLDEIARDYNSNWMTAIEILSNDTYLGTETYSNLFTLKRNTTSPLEEVRCRLMTHGEYNLGQMINKLARGSLVIPTNTSSAGTTTTSSSAGGDHSSPTKASTLMDTTSGSTPSKSKTSSPTIGTPSTPSKEGGSSSGSSTTPMDIVVGSQTLYGTVDGSIGCILGMNHETFQFFKSLECVMADYLPRIGGLRHEEFRSFAAEKRFHLCRHFIDGDLVESFLDLSRSQMEIIVELLQKPEAGGIPRHSMSIEDVVSMVEEVSRLH